jgi:hypothetical protein
VVKPAGSQRMTNKNASLKLITSFAPPDKASFRFPGLKSDDRTPTNGPWVTPIAESAASPGATPGDMLRPQARSKSSLAKRAATPGALYKHRLPSIGETPIDGSMTLFARPSALPTPDNSGSELEKESVVAGQPTDEAAAQSADPEPPLLLSSARYDPGSAMPGRSPMTALPMAADEVPHLPSPAEDKFTVQAEKSRGQNGSRDRKPDGLHLHMPPHTSFKNVYLSSGGLGSGTSELRKSNPSGGSQSARLNVKSVHPSPSISGQSWQSAKSPSVSSRSGDQYISSLGEVGSHNRRRKSTSRRRHISREGRSQTGEKKSRSKQRGLDRSEDRGRGNQRHIRLAKRSPSSPVPMSPDDINFYQDNPNAQSLNAQLAGATSAGPGSTHGPENISLSKGISNLRSGSRASDFSNRTAVRRRSREGIADSQLGTEASFGTGSMMSSRQESAVSSRQHSPDASFDSSYRGRSKSKDPGSAVRSPSSPSPMSPQLKHYERSDDEEDWLRLVEANRQRIRSRHRSSSRKPRERGTSARGDKSPDRRRVKESHKARSVQGNHSREAQVPRSAVETSFVPDEQFAQALDQMARGGKMTASSHRKALAARELEARRVSLAQRPSAPAIPHPTDLASPRPPLGARSQTDLGDVATSWGNPSTSLKHKQRMGTNSNSPDLIDHGNRAAMSGPYGLPATPRAMRHPRYDSGQHESIPPLPEVPESGAPTTDIFATGQPMREFPRSMSAPIPEAHAPPAPSELPSHPAFHKALHTTTKRSNFAPLGDIGQYRRRPSTDMISISGPIPIGTDEEPQAAYSSIQNSTNEQPPLLPELQHLSANIPPPPPPPPAFPNEVLAHHSASSGSGLGVINIAIDDAPRNEAHVIDVPTIFSLPAQSPAPNFNSERSTPMTVVRSSSNHRRGRSENFKNNIKGITDRLRSTSRGPNNNNLPHMEQPDRAPSAYESVPPLYF